MNLIFVVIAAVLGWVIFFRKPKTVWTGKPTPSEFKTSPTEPNFPALTNRPGVDAGINLPAFNNGTVPVANLPSVIFVPDGAKQLSPGDPAPGFGGLTITETGFGLPVNVIDASLSITKNSEYVYVGTKADTPIGQKMIMASDGQWRPESFFTDLTLETQERILAGEVGVIPAFV